MSTVDRAALIEQADNYLRMVKCTERSCGTRVRYGELTDDANTHWHIKPGVALVAIPALPVIAKALLAPLREAAAHVDPKHCLCPICDERTRMLRLIDAIEAEVQP
jgi:hypothetical protein